MKYNSSLRTVANTGHSDFHKMTVIYKTAYLLIAIKKNNFEVGNDSGTDYSFALKA